MDIEEVCRRARAEGLSYGQYVYKHRAELAGKRPEPKLKKGEIFCKHCGKGFVPTAPSNVFCCTACRANYNARKQKERKKAYD